MGAYIYLRRCPCGQESIVQLLFHCVPVLAVMKSFAAQKDLSHVHEPLGSIFSLELPEPETSLNSEQIRFFHENGFISGIRILDQGQIAALRTELACLMEHDQAANPLFYEYHHNESKDASMTLFHALGAWRVSEVFHDLLFHGTIVSVAEQLLDGPVRFWHDQVFVKPPLDGGVVAWHQDYSYWTRTVPVAHLTCWIGLDDSNEENGCVNYVPGSHRWDLLPRTDLANDMTAVLDVLSDEQKDNFKPFPAILKAGEASFHHPLTLHGSYANRSARPRRAAVLNFFRDGVRSNSDEPLLEGVAPIRKGTKIEGRFFPLLTRANP